MLTRSTVYRASLEALVIYTLVFCIFLLYLYDYFLLVFNIDTLLYGYKFITTSRIVLYGERYGSRRAFCVRPIRILTPQLRKR